MEDHLVLIFQISFHSASNIIKQFSLVSHALLEVMSVLIIELRVRCLLLDAEEGVGGELHKEK